MSTHTVYFLGAGCSKNFGYPLTAQIMPLLMQRLLAGSLFSMRDNGPAFEKKQQRELLQLLYILYPGLKQANLKDETQQKQLPGITEVLSLVDHFCMYNLPPHPDVEGARLQNFRDLLCRALGEVILEYDLRSANAAEQRLFNAFIKPIRKKAENEKITIITTNYDLLIDWEFRDIFLKNKVDYGISYRNVDNSAIVYRDASPHFHYYKLHGSLNWLRCDLCGFYYINPSGSIIHNAFRKTTNSNNTCTCSDTLRLKSVLVAPSIVRDIRDPNLLQIWKASVEAIRTATHIIMVGYSLPGEDLAIKSVLMRGLNGRAGKTPLQVDVVQKGEAALPAYQHLFGKKINYEKEGLPRYLGVG